MRLRRCAPALIFAALSGCAHSQTSRVPAASPASPGSAAAPLPPAPSGPVLEYRISPNDLLAISVHEELDLSKEARVSHDGLITFPLLGEVAVAGRTEIETENLLRSRLKGFLVDPHPSVTVKQYHRRSVFILGEVAKPGSYAMPPDRSLSVVEAIARGGGFTKFAAPDHTRVIRRAGGAVQTFIVPVAEVTAGNDSKDILLNPDDVVFIPETFF